MKDFQSGQICFDTNKIIADYAREEQQRREKVHVSPITQHRRNKFQDMSSIQIYIGEDLRQAKENMAISGRAYSPRQHSHLEK